MDTKKTWEKLSPLIPLYQAFALPMYKDKQLSQPTSLRIIVGMPLENCINTILPWHKDIIHPTWTLRCGIFLVHIIKGAKFDIAEDNVQKTSFMLRKWLCGGTKPPCERPCTEHVPSCLDPPCPQRWLAKSLQI